MLRHKTKANKNALFIQTAYDKYNISQTKLETLADLEAAEVAEDSADGITARCEIQEDNVKTKKASVKSN